MVHLIYVTVCSPLYIFESLGKAYVTYPKTISMGYAETREYLSLTKKKSEIGDAEKSLLCPNLED